MTAPLASNDASTLRSPAAPARRADSGEATTHSSACPDAALLARLRAGDDAAFAELVRETSPRLLGTARRMIGDDDAARDVLQNAFTSAWRALPTFHGESKLSTWLHRILINAALMHLRARRRRPEESLEALLPRFDDDGLWIETPEAFPAPDALGDRERLRTLVRRCVAQLPDAHREILVLRDFEELDTEEAATLLGIRPDAAKMRLHRARQALRALLVRELPRD
jgi:RNA polymerase sigma-70 factor (ECF subfamily)